MTTGAFVLFVVLCLALAILSGKQRTSVMENVAPPPPVETSQPAEPALGSVDDEAVPAADSGDVVEGAGATDAPEGGGENE
jgi:hypothetical protein